MTERQAVKLSSLQSSTTDTLLSMGFSADDAARAVRLLYPPLRSTVGANP
jgi:Holliday junction resolvasome RuvABC DNA-binding subunit